MNVNINITGDLHIHFGGDVLESLLPDDISVDETETEAEDYENNEIDPSGVTISVGGLPKDVDREIVESILAATAELLNEEVCETIERQTDEAHVRV